MNDETPPGNESYLEVPQVRDEEVETLISDLHDDFDDVWENTNQRPTVQLGGAKILFMIQWSTCTKNYPILSLNGDVCLENDFVSTHDHTSFTLYVSVDVTCVRGPWLLFILKGYYLNIWVHLGMS